MSTDKKSNVLGVSTYSARTSTYSARTYLYGTVQQAAAADANFCVGQAQERMKTRKKKAQTPPTNHQPCTNLAPTNHQPQIEEKLPAFGCSGSFGSQNSLVAVTSVISVALNNRPLPYTHTERLRNSRFKTTDHHPHPSHNHHMIKSSFKLH